MAWSQSPVPLGDPAERDDVADLHGRGVVDDAVDEEFDDRPPLLEGGPLQAPREGRPELLRPGGEDLQVLVLHLVGLALLRLAA